MGVESLKFRVVLDCRMYGMSGIGRYTESLLEEIGNQPIPDFEFVLLDFQGRVPASKHTTNVVEIIETGAPPLSPKEALRLPRLLKRLSRTVHLFHFTHSSLSFPVPKNSIITVHDLIPIKLSKYFPKLKVEVLKLLLRVNLKRARKIIAVSETTKMDVCELLGVLPEKVRVVYERVPDISECVRSDRTRETLEHGRLASLQGKNYFLYVGNRKPHKRVELAIEVLDKLFDEVDDWFFVIAGSRFSKKDFVDEAIERSRNRDRFVQIVNPSDEELCELYKNAHALILLSDYEGFGLVPIEAGYFGVPSVVSSNGSLPEIVGDGGIVVDANDKKGLLETIRGLTVDRDLRKEKSEKARARAEIFKRYPQLEKTLEVYREALENVEVGLSRD